MRVKIGKRNLIADAVLEIVFPGPIVRFGSNRTLEVRDLKGPNEPP
jgi:hypothetical protein